MLKPLIVQLTTCLIILSNSVALAAPPADPSTGSSSQQAAPPATAPVTQPATSSPPPAAAPVTATTPSKSKYSAGNVITVHQLIERGKGNYQPGNSIGSFVNQANPWALGLHHQQAELKFFQGEPLGYMVDSYFVAKDAGNYSFAVEVDLPPAVVFRDPEKFRGAIHGKIACHYRFMVDNQVIIELDANSKARGTRKEELACGLTEHGIGAVQLEPGYHPVQQWLACTGERKLKLNDAKQFSYPTNCPESGKKLKVDSFPGDEVQVTLRVRHPKDSTPTLVEADELVHK